MAMKEGKSDSIWVGVVAGAIILVVVICLVFFK